jgi:TonB family protein
MKYQIIFLVGLLMFSRIAYAQSGVNFKIDGADSTALDGYDFESIQPKETTHTDSDEGTAMGYDFGDISTLPQDGNPGPNDFVICEKAPQPLNLDSVKMVIGYPNEAKEREIEGKVVVKVLVDEHGKYVKHLVIKDPNPIFTHAVVARLSELRFIPAVQSGKAIRYWISLPFEFKLVK